MIKSTSGTKSKEASEGKGDSPKEDAPIVQSPGTQQNMLRTVTAFCNGVERYVGYEIRLLYSDAADA